MFDLPFLEEKEVETVIVCSQRKGKTKLVKIS